MASLAGNGLPRTTAGSHGSRLRGDLAFTAVLALLACAVIAGGVALYPQTSDASRQRAEEAILPGNHFVAESAAALEHAEKLDDLADAGAAAHAAITDVELVDARDISNPEFRRAAKKLLHAQLALLSALEPLVDLDESTVGKWRRHSREIRAAVRQIASAQPAVARLELTSEINVWGPVLSWSLANADAVVAKASRRLGAWRSEVQTIRQERRAALAAVTSYDSSVRSYLAAYDGLGRDLEGVKVRQAKKLLRRASAARQSVRDDIAALTPPAAVASAHTALVNSLDHTISESVRARSRWQDAVSAEVNRIKAIKTPKRPDV
jgi:hypothetical protein